MDRQFSNPRALADSSPEEVQRALRRVLVGLQSATEFLYEAQFRFANGRTAPVFLVGALRGSWREYMRRNAAAAGFCAGECHPRRGDDGRLVLELMPVRGRARGGANTRTINLNLMRGLGEVRFVEVASDGVGGSPGAASAQPAEASAAAQPPVASAGGSAAASPAAARLAAAGQGTGPLTESAVDSAALLAAFADFKATPTTPKLDALQAGIVAWRAAGGGGDNAAQLEKIASLLAEKGRAYVAAKAG